MPRQARPVIPEIPLHITQRGNNRQTCFYGDSDFLVYLDLLRIAAQQASCHVHAYALMSNHVHLLISPDAEHGPATLMKSLGERYVQYVNRRHKRTGTLWEGRYRSCLVECERYLMICQRYIELNPVRAQMVKHPADYRWSSYRHNAGSEKSELITPHSLYCRLGNDPRACHEAYRALLEEALPNADLDQVRFATYGNGVLGTQEFADDMGALLGRSFWSKGGQ
jgi:putative transposase